MRHLATTYLWILEEVKSKEIAVQKDLGTENPADVLTKYVDRASMEKAMTRLNMLPMDGRPSCAPMAMGVAVNSY